MSGRVGWPILLATAVGLAIGLWAIERTGLRPVIAALARIGWTGFGLYLVSYLFTLVALGGAWAWSLREGPHPLPLFTWARALREAANDLLPFSQIGGLVIGTRVLVAAGIAPARTYAATLIDLTTEIVAQLVLTVLGLALVGRLATARPGAVDLDALAWAGAAGLGALAIGMLVLQRPFLKMASALSGRFLPQVGQTIDAVHAELTAFGRRRGAMIPSFLWNLAAWLLSILSAWIALRLLGAPLSFGRTLAIETLIFALRSSAFLVPGALGVQEAGYVLLAPLVGLDGEVALALSLVKRGRDVALGVPVLLLWQWQAIRGRFRA